MSPLPFGELTNEILDFSPETTAALLQQDMFSLSFGVLVTLLPKVIPLLFPAVVGHTAKERLDSNNLEVSARLEDDFREKFLDNLKIIESYVSSWKAGDLGKLGVDGDFFQDKEALVGIESTVQSQVLQSISFIKDRIERSQDEDDAIVQFANKVWDISIMIAQTLRSFY